MPSHVLVIGRGQLAQALLESEWSRAFASVARPELDFDRIATIAPALARHAPSVIVNAAAYTSVDAAETEKATAWRANCEGPREIARFCARHQVPFLHISTDYVFDGTKGAPYREEDAPAPLGVYGASKLAGERAALDEGGRVIILRTAGLISARGHNFVRMLLASRAKRPCFRVVADQRGTPTAADDLARGIGRIIERIARAPWRAEYGGVFHAAGSAEASWYDLARAVFEIAARYGLPCPEVVPISLREWAARASRPIDSRLACDRLDRVFGVHLPGWRESLEGIVRAVLEGARASGPSAPGTRRPITSR